MLATAAAAAPAKALVGKKELALRLGWSRPTLDRRLDQDPKFPVVMRGTQQGGWAFDPDDVAAYLGVATFEDEPDDLTFDPEPEPTRAPAARAEHQGEVTARQRTLTAQAQLLEDRLARQRGDLVEVGPLKLRLATAVTKLSTSLNVLPDTLGRRLHLPETATAIVRQEVEDARRAFFAELRELLTGE